jgi:hypothetical protein
VISESEGLMSHRVELIGKPGCHLCDEARLVIEQVCSQLGVTWAEYSIFDDPKLASQYAEFIPVVLVDGKPHDQFGVDPARLHTALSACT